MLAAAVIIFLLAFIYFYPLTLRFYYTGQRAELQWLPRVCGGFARPKNLRFSQGPRKNTGKSKRLRMAKRLLSRIKLRAMLPLLRWLPGHIHVLRLYWQLMLAPAARYGFSASVECILSMRCGDIIFGIIYAWLLYKKQKPVAKGKSMKQAAKKTACL